MREWEAVPEGAIGGYCRGHRVYNYEGDWTLLFYTRHSWLDYL